MARFDDLPEGWVVWNDEPAEQTVLVYRPDVFDSQAFPPACLPTLSLTTHSPDRPPGERTRESRWHVVFYLEPDVRVRELEGTFDTREAAIDEAFAIADAFARGEVDYRASYQVPRETYLDRLDDLTGRDA